VNTFRTRDPEDYARPTSTVDRSWIITKAVAKWVIFGGVVVFGSITAAGTLGLDPFWSSLVGFALAFGVIVWHMPKKVRR